MKRQVVNGRINSTLFAVTWSVVVFVVAQTTPARAQLSELYPFQYNSVTTSNYPDGANPMAELIQGADGNYYTTTNIGGAGTCPGEVEDQIPGCGAVVKITPAGGLSVLYSFPYDTSTSTAPDGWFPQAGLVQGKDGNFYGVTTIGGTTAGLCATSGCGTIFKLTPSGTVTLLHAFCGSDGCGSLTTDGSMPLGRLVLGATGKLYGTTYAGSLTDGEYNGGIIFSVSTTGSGYEVLHNFSGNTGSGDGWAPAAGLTRGTDGNFYGTTELGGSGGLDQGEGTVFKMTPAGKVTILHSFVGSDGAGSDGSYPKGALVEASDGNFYGTCYSGGANGTGTVFRISTKGVFTKIYDFVAEGASGGIGNYPRAGLIQASDGNLYGTAWDGGVYNSGTIYQLTLDGVGTLEASFDPGTDGFSPLGALVQGSDGRLYVTLQDDGGENSDDVQDQGAISVLNLQLAAPAPTILSFTPAKAKVGAKVTIYGTSFVGTTSVKFGGVAAPVIDIDGSGVLTVTVPTGAMSGQISVTNAGGMAVTVKDFTVL